MIGRQVYFENGTTGVVVIHRPPVIFVYAATAKDSSGQDNNKNDSTTTTTTTMQQPKEGVVTVYDNLFTIEVPKTIQQSDCFGRTTTNNSNDETTTTGGMLTRPIFSPIPQVKDIALINKPLVTGVTMFDALAPIGKGQNMLLVGHDIEDMRKYVTDILSIQTKAEQPPTKCIYAFTGNKQ